MKVDDAGFEVVFFGLYDFCVYDISWYCVWNENHLALRGAGYGFALGSGS